MLKRIFHYLNPVANLGVHRSAFTYPFFFTLSICILTEGYLNLIAKSTNYFNMLTILIFTILIIYLSFRNGIISGLVAATVVILYYIYNIYLLSSHGRPIAEAIVSTLIVGFLYYFLAVTIGWLKQTIDTLIEREAHEKRRLQAVVQQLPVGILLTDEEGKITLVNRLANTILGRKIPLGLNVRQQSLISSNNNTKTNYSTRGPLAKTLSAKKPIVGREITLINANGNKVYVRISTSIIKNRKGKVIAAAEILSDVTQQKEIEARKDDFITIASHELKTPITSMNLYVHSLLNRTKKLGDEQSLHILQSLNGQMERLQKIVTDLLDVSSLQTGKLNFTKETFRLDRLIEEIVYDLQATTQQKIVFSHHKHVTVYADKFRIYQVLTNLITNALKYSAGKGNIIISLVQEKGEAIVRVRDFGIGIAKEQQTQIFERLYQVPDDKGKTFPGFGMGLYISREIIKRHKGKIWVESKKGKGANFYFSLPLPKNM